MAEEGKRDKSRPDNHTRRINYTLAATATVSCVIAIFSTSLSLYYARQAVQRADRANTISEEANRIARSSTSAQIAVRELFIVTHYADDFSRPCINSLGATEWSIDFAVAFDVSNIGSKATSLIDVQPNVTNYSAGVFETYLPSVEGNTKYDFFTTQDDFEKWYVSKANPGNTLLYQNRTTLDYSSTPLKLESGDTLRILLHGHQRVIFGANMDANQIYESLLTATWNQAVQFVFADGTVQEGTVPLHRPYQYDPPLRPQPLTHC